MMNGIDERDNVREEAPYGGDAWLWCLHVC